MNTELRVEELLRSKLDFEPSPGQSDFLSRFSRFAVSEDTKIFLLKGYAGTGKTSLLKTMVDSFTRIVLLAPTGRAAQVLQDRTGLGASTIHRYLYRVRHLPGGKAALSIAPNVHKKTLFVVDEASMIADKAIGSEESLFPGVNLLYDLFLHIFSGPSCKLLLVGDTAQLPPVHFTESPALDAVYISHQYRHAVAESELKEVYRQQGGSGILQNATYVRELLAALLEKGDTGTERVEWTEHRDYRATGRMELEELLPSLYASYGRDQVLVITRSNRDAYSYNRLIRQRYLWMEEELDAGEELMIVRNNYHWLPADYPSGFLANGDRVVIQKIIRFSERGEFRFVRVSLLLPDQPGLPPFEAWVLLNTLSSEAPALTETAMRKLFSLIEEDYLDEPNTKRRAALVRKDDFYNALQVKYAYAVTAHKSQGGQWKAVLVDFGYLNTEQAETDFLRWYYTAITRATELVYLIQPPALLVKSNG